VSHTFRRAGRRTAVCAALGCAGLLVVGALSGTAAADAPGVPGQVARPAPSAPVPTFTIPGRSAHTKSARITGKAVPRDAAATAAHPSDFDGDGADDLVYRLSGGDVLLYLGGSTYYDVISYDTSQVKDLLTPGDLTGDGKPDLLTLTASGQLRLHSGANPLQDNGLASYTTIGASGWQQYSKVIAPGDLNGDGRPDLLARSTAGLFFYPGTGDAAKPFGARVQIGGAGWNQYNQLVGVGDFDGDGIGDVIARNADGLWLYSGNGSATAGFKSKTQIGGTGWSQYNQVIGGGDYDANGTHDLLARSYDGTLYFYEGNGNGTFDPTRQEIGAPWGDVTQFAGGGANPAYGKNGIFANTPSGDLYYYDGTGTGTLTAKTSIGGGWDRTAVRLYHVSSLRDDGISDLIGQGLADGHLYNFGAYADDELAGGSTAYNLLVGPGDLNGDGKGDLLARSSSALYFYAGNGDGNSMKSRVQVGGSGWSQYNSIVGAGDLNGDGRADIVARSSAGLFLYTGTGNATSPFSARKQIGGTGWSQYNKLIAPGDINGDGVADLLARSSSGLFFYPGTGTGTFGARVQIGGTGWSQYADLI
jgi:hypothetical protein